MDWPYRMVARWTFHCLSFGDKTIRLWDAQTGQHIRTITGQLVLSSVWYGRQMEKLLASGSGDKTIRFGMCRQGKSVQTLEGQTRFGHTV